MATQILSDAELEKLRRFPELSREELVRYFTLTPADESFLIGHRRQGNRLGVAVQLCTLAWLGFVPDDVASAPAQAVERLADHLGVPVEALSSYGARDHTRTDHLVEVTKFLRWRQAGGVERKELSHLLAARAMEARLTERAVPPGLRVPANFASGPPRPRLAVAPGRRGT
jgi:hypothetical protein